MSDIEPLTAVLDEFGVSYSVTVTATSEPNLPLRLVNVTRMGDVGPVMHKLAEVGWTASYSAASGWSFFPRVRSGVGHE